MSVWKVEEQDNQTIFHVSDQNYHGSGGRGSKFVIPHDESYRQELEKITPEEMKERTSISDVSAEKFDVPEVGTIVFINDGSNEDFSSASYWLGVHTTYGPYLLAGEIDPKTAAESQTLSII